MVKVPKTIPASALDPENPLPGTNRDLINKGPLVDHMPAAKVKKATTFDFETAVAKGTENKDRALAKRELNPNHALTEEGEWAPWDQGTGHTESTIMKPEDKLMSPELLSTNAFGTLDAAGEADEEVSKEDDQSLYYGETDFPDDFGSSDPSSGEVK